MLSNSRISQTFICFAILSILSFSNLVAKDSSGSNFTKDVVEQECQNLLEWYNDHPGYKGEFVRVFDYCKKHAKDVSPKGFKVNPILSDFGSMSGVNTRPRDTIHQGIDIIGSKNQPIIAIKDGKVLESTIEDCWGGTIVVDHGKSFDGKRIIAIYGHVGEFMVNENDLVKRGDVIVRLPKKLTFYAWHE